MCIATRYTFVQFVAILVVRQSIYSESPYTFTSVRRTIAFIRFFFAARTRLRPAATEYTHLIASRSDQAMDSSNALHILHSTAYKFEFIYCWWRPPTHVPHATESKWTNVSFYLNCVHIRMAGNRMSSNDIHTHTHTSSGMNRSQQVERNGRIVIWVCVSCMTKWNYCILNSSIFATNN